MGGTQEMRPTRRSKQRREERGYSPHSLSLMSIFSYTTVALASCGCDVGGVYLQEFVNKITVLFTWLSASSLLFWTLSPFLSHSRVFSSPLFSSSHSLLAMDMHLRLVYFILASLFLASFFLVFPRRPCAVPPLRRPPVPIMGI